MRTLPCIVSNSYAGRDFLVEKFDLSPERVRIINNGVVLPTNTEDTIWREKLGLDSGDVLITMVANLTQYKDHDTLLRSFALVRESPIGRKCKLVLAGQYGKTTINLKALAFDLDFGNSVKMVGAIDDIGGLLNASDLVVHSSVNEGCPNAVLEAMAHRKCVVGTDISGIRQALGENAVGKYLASPREPNHLAKLIIRLAGSSSERLEAGTENRARIETEFSISRMTKHVLHTVFENRL